MSNIARELARARTGAGLTQTAAARKLGVTQARLSQIEHGHNTRLDTLQSYARVLGLELLLVPQNQLRRVRAMLNDSVRDSAEEDRPSRFPSLADLIPPDADEKHRRSRPAKKIRA